MVTDREQDIIKRLNDSTMQELSTLNPHKNLPSGVTIQEPPAAIAARQAQAQSNALSKMDSEELNILRESNAFPELRNIINDLITSRQKETYYNNLINQPNAVGSPAMGGSSVSTNVDMDQIVKEAINRGQNLNDILDKIYSAQEMAGKQKLEEQYNPLREQQINEQAALGTLRQGTGEAGRNVFDLQKQKTLTQMLNEIAQNKAQAQLGVSQGTAADIARARELGINAGFKGQELGLQGRQLDLTKLLETLRLRNQEEQFGQNLGLEQQKLNLQNLINAQQLGMQRNEQGLAGNMFQQQMQEKREARKPGILDYLNTGFQGLNALANVTSTVKPKGFF